VPPQPRHDDYGSGSGGAGGIVGGGSRTRPHVSRSTAAASSQSRINLSKLQTSALKRYGTVYHLVSVAGVAFPATCCVCSSDVLRF
jgi:hypothetical protein